MSLDIVEIALANITDHEDFEKLASEIMRNEGYHTIKPLGGKHDLGRDAIEERLFTAVGKVTTVFQYTLERDLNAKLKNTVRRLEEAGVEYGELVLVTPRKVSTQSQDQLKRHARATYGISIDIYERKTLVNRLADYNNGIFHRHFPYFEKQFKELGARRPILSQEGASDLEIAMLKAATALTFGKESVKARDSIFDYLTLAIILIESGDSISVDQIHEKLSNHLVTNKPSSSQVRSSLDRLQKKKFINLKENAASATALAIERSEGVTIQTNEATDSLINDIVAQVCDVYGKPIPLNVERALTRNTKDALVWYFRLFGTELCSHFFDQSIPSLVYVEGSLPVIEQTKRGLPKEIGEILVNAIAEILANPSEEHANTLSDWSLAFLGIQIMNLDPALRELEMTRLATKTFILDTDFVLDCVVQENPVSRTFIKFVRDLKNLGCRVIVPDVSVDECVEHAKASFNTFHYFRDNLFSYDEAFINEMVGNVFVKGCYHAYHSGNFKAGWQFKKYLNNYYDNQQPRRFLKQVIQAAMPNGVEITKLTALLQSELPEKQMELMKRELYDLICQSRKGLYREEKQNRQLAETDARLFLTALHLNAPGESTPNSILGGSCYLITSSTMYIRAAKHAGIRDVVTTRPQSIGSLLEVIGETSINGMEMVRLFENPFIIHAVRESIDDVKRLVDSGLDLRGRSLTRLRWDLEESLHSQLALIERADEMDQFGDDIARQDKDTERFTGLIKDALSKGYRLVPEVNSLLQRLEKRDTEFKKKTGELEELLKKFDELEGKFSEFSKRKQRYLRRMLRKAKGA